jgi:hypothetical protein
VLPETKTAREVFASYDVDEYLRMQASNPSDPVLPAAASADAPNGAIWPTGAR